MQSENKLKSPKHKNYKLLNEISQSSNKRFKDDKSDCPPNVSAKSWKVFNVTNGTTVSQKDAHRKREIASLTKIMTFYTTLQLLQRFSLNPDQVYFKISLRSANVTGTSAELRFGDKVDINNRASLRFTFAILSNSNFQVLIVDLLYALMLPSGNDAAQAIAENFGYLIKLFSRSPCEPGLRNPIFQNLIKDYVLDVPINLFQLKDYSKHFVFEMNVQGK